jgi:hypothetical protein
MDLESSADRAGGVASRRLGVLSGVFAHPPQRPRLESPYRFKPAANIISSRPSDPNHHGQRTSTVKRQRSRQVSV